jgi:hypothetical protein
LTILLFSFWPNLSTKAKPGLFHPVNWILKAIPGMGGQQEWVTGLEDGKIYTSDHWGLSSGGQTVVEGPPFNYYNYQGDVQHGHIPVDISREVYEAVK